MRSLLVAGEPDLAERIHLLRRPIREFGSLRPRDRWKSDDPAVVTFAARITPEKGLAVLIEALGALRGDGPIELCIAGLVEHGAYWAHCQRLQAIAIVTNPHLTVTYLGHLDYAATDDLFRRSDIVAIPSQWPEPLGAVAMEAMSGRERQSSPRTSVGSTPISLTAATDYLVDASSAVTAWTETLELLLQHPARARHFGAQAHRDASRITAADHLQALDAMVLRPRCVAPT